MDSYEDYTDFNSFKDDDASVEKCIHQSMDRAYYIYTYNFNEQEIGEFSQNLKSSTNGGKPRGNSPAAETSRVQGMRGGSPSERQLKTVGNPKEILQLLKLRVFRVCEGGHPVKKHPSHL